MKTIKVSFVALFVLGLFAAFRPIEAPKAASSWSVDAVHSSVVFNVRHFFSDVAGSFDKFTGELAFDPADLAGSSVSFEIDVTSVNTKNERRDGHLQSGDFFDAEKFPKMTFASKSIAKADGGDNLYIVTGDMTIKDVTKSIEVPVKFLGKMDHMMREGYEVGGFSAEFSINRNDYGVGAGNYAATTVIGDEVKITINLEVNRQKES